MDSVAITIPRRGNSSEIRISGEDHDEVKAMKLKVRGDTVIYEPNDGQAKTRSLHLLIVERKLGRALTTKDRVSFVDGDRFNLTRGNLVLKEGRRKQADTLREELQEIKNRQEEYRQTIEQMREEIASVRQQQADESKNLNEKLLEYRTIIDDMKKMDEKRQEEQEARWRHHHETIISLTQQIKELREESEARWQNNIEIMKEKERQFERKIATNKSPSEKSSGSSRSGDLHEELDDFFSVGIRKLPDEDISKANPRSRLPWPTTEEVIQAFVSFSGKKPKKCHVVDKLVSLTGHDRTTRLKVEGRNMLKVWPIVIKEEFAKNLRSDLGRF